MNAKPIRDYDDPDSLWFFESLPWKKLRYRVFKEQHGRCQCCGRDAHDFNPMGGRVKLAVDHILPRKTHPHLALDISNLQLLCFDCNEAKGNIDTTDWRRAQPQEQKHD